MRLIDYAIERWQITLVFFGLLAAIGANALLSIPRSVDPHFPIPLVLILVTQPGADPADMEQTVARPIEDALVEIDDIDEIRSRSVEGASVIFAEFDWSTDPEKKYDDVVSQVNAIRDTLPGGIRSIEFRKFRTTETKVLQLALVSETASWRRMQKVAEDLRDRLSQVTGARRSDVYGLRKPTIEVALDSGRLAQYGVPATTVVDALAAGGTDLPAGAVHSGTMRLSVEAGGAFRSLDEIADVPLRAANGRLLRVRDVADVAWGYGEEQEIVRFNGKRAVWVTLEQKDNVNVLDLRKRAAAEVELFKRELPPDMRIEIAFDQSVDIADKLRRLSIDFAIALGIVLITLLPLGPRAAAVVMVSIPLSLALGVTVLNLLGFTLNQLAVTGFIVALGLLVDDSIVVVENIARHLRMGQSRLEAARSGTREIAVAVVGCTFVLLFAFLPLIFLPEGAGKFTRSLPLAVVATVAASLLVSLTIVPFLASRILPRTETEHGNRFLRAVQGGIHRLYQPALHWSLTHPWKSLAAATLLCLSSLAIIPVVGTSLFPDADSPYFRVDIAMPPGTSLEATERAARHADAVLAAEPMIVNRMVNIGRANPQIFYNVRDEESRSDTAQIVATIDEWTPAVPARIEALRRKLEAYPEGRITVEAFKNGPPIDAPIEIRVVGPEVDRLQAIAAQVDGVMRGVPGVRDIDNPVAVDRIDLDLGLDSDKAALLGIQPGAPRRAARLALAGESAGRLRDAEGDSFDVVVRLPIRDRQGVSALDAIYLPSANGGAVPLRQVAVPRLQSSPSQINRFELQRTVTVSAQVVDGFNTAKVTAAVVQALDRIDLPAGYAFKIGGEANARSESFGGMLPFIMIAIFGILGTLVVEFGRFRETAVVFGVVPLGMFGGLVALLLTGNSISYVAIIGFVALIGIEIKNSILLVDFTTQLRDQGLALRDAIERAGEVRFLPVLLTSLTAIGGLLPLALSGSPLFAPLAWVIIGGLVSSTLLSRIVTPVMYLLLARGAPEAGTAAAGQSLAEAA